MNTHITIGMDLGDRHHITVILDANGNEVSVSKVTNTKSAIMRYFSPYKNAAVAIEAGTHSPWISALLEAMGCTVYVGNPRKLRLIWDSHDKSDERDARMLALVCRVEPKLLWPIKHKNAKTHCDLALIKSRYVLVKNRTALINHVRGIVKSHGERMPSCSAASFAKRCRTQIPQQLNSAVEPVMNMIEQLNAQIRQLDRTINELCQCRYPEAERLQTVTGVGPLTALAYILTLEDPKRFFKSRQVGAYLGLTPRRDQSGQSDKQLPITKAGNRYLRQLMVSCAQYILGPFGPDSDLRRFGLSIAARGGKNAKKRAAVAVARKLAVLLHRIWLSGQDYQPFYQSHLSQAA